MAWVPIANSLPAVASDLNDNFDVVAAGSRLPMSSSGSNFGNTTSVYDLGASASRWATGYINNLNISGSFTTANNSLWYLVTEVTLSATASSIEISGLNGDVDDTYMIIARCVSDQGGNMGMNIYFNDDFGLVINYGYQHIYGESTAVTSARNNGTDGIQVSEVSDDTSTSIVSFSKSILYAKTGFERVMISMSLDGGGDTRPERIVPSAGIWKDTTSTITSITIREISVASFDTSTSVQLWKRA